MNTKRTALFLSFLTILTGGLLPADLSAQSSPSTQLKTVAADTTFIIRSGSFQKKWGPNRRKEWATPVTVPLLWLDSTNGGLRPRPAGGGNETNSMQLTDINKREYALRSINKSRKDVIPPGFENTFVQTVIMDQVSSSYPYGAFVVTGMQDAAHIAHSKPRLVYLPPQAALDSLNDRYANALYLFEERPDGDWSSSPNMGGFKEFTSTEKLIKKLQEDNRYRTDQHAFIRARLFDMLIADWDRHEDNWRWGRVDSSGYRLYVPVPRDRDQAFYTHNGWLINRLMPIGGFSFMQHFDHIPGSMVSLNSEEKDMDRYFSNAMTLDDWQNEAKFLQTTLTDTVIAASVRQLPPEIFAVSGQELIDKLKSRRGYLVEMATSYYKSIAVETEVVGTEKREYFEVKGDNDALVVSVYRMEKGIRKEIPFYSRRFVPAETQEVRLFGIDGEDIYSVHPHSSGITVRVIGGPGKDSILQEGNQRFHIYDDRDNYFQVQSATKHLKKDSAIHAFDYTTHEYSSRGWAPSIAYDHQDRVYVGLNYRFKKYKWRRLPYASQHVFGINYSITQHAVSTSWNSTYPRIIHGWDLIFGARYDNAGWVNFAGLGNETTWQKNKRIYYQLRGSEITGTLGIRRSFAKSSLSLAAVYQRVHVTKDDQRYAAKVYSLTHTGLYDAANYAGLRLSYTFASVNDVIVPTKGVSLLATGFAGIDFSQSEFFQHYTARLQGWLPLGKKFSLSVKAGGTTVAGNSTVINSARPYEHAIIGGPENLRGYRIERFWGKSSFYNNNELRFITNIRSFLLNARAGLMTFFDDGRVWQPGENSTRLHTSYGGGVILAPFNQFSFTLTYGVSPEMRLFQFRFNTLF